MLRTQWTYRQPEALASDRARRQLPAASARVHGSWRKASDPRVARGSAIASNDPIVTDFAPGEVGGKNTEPRDLSARVLPAHRAFADSRGSHNRIENMQSVGGRVYPQNRFGEVKLRCPDSYIAGRIRVESMYVSAIGESCASRLITASFGSQGYGGGAYP